MSQKNLTQKIFQALMLLFVFTATLNLKAKVTNLDAKVPLPPKVITGKLSNGFTYFVMENKKPEKRAEIQLITRAGSVQETEAQRGLAHFTEHMCFNGTKNFPKGELINFLESTGTRFGSDLNAYTSFDVTRYTLTIQMDKADLLAKSMQVMEDWASAVSFDNEEIEKERGVILEEKRLGKGANERLMDKHFPVLLKGSKYADRLPIGLEEVISKAPRQEFLDYYNDWYRPDMQALIVVGDVNTAEVVALIKKHFEPLKFRGQGTPKDKGKYPIPANQEPLVSIGYDKELQYPMSQVYIKYNDFDKTTYRGVRQLYKEQIFSQMLSMRLTELTKLPEPPYLMGFGAASEFIGETRALAVITIPGAGGFNKAFEAGLGELFRANQYGFTAGELERTKSEILAGMEKNYNERDKTESITLAQEIYQYYDNTMAMPGIEAEYELVKEFMTDITLDEINKMTSEMITPHNLVITVSLPESSPEKPTEAEILALYKAAQGKKYDAYADELGDKPLMSKIPPPGKVTSTKKLPNYDITEMKLSNGARVLLLPTEHKNDQILFSTWASGGLSLYTNLADYRNADEATAIVDEAGLGEWSSVNLGKLLQGKILNLSPYISDYSQGMSGSTTPKDIETFFQVLNMQFNEPRKDSEAFKSFLSKVREIVKNKERSPESALNDTLQAVLGGYDARKMPVTMKDLDGLSLDKAFNLYKERFSDASNFTFLFVGSFKINEIQPLIEKYIASLPATNKAEKFKDMGIKIPAGQVSKVVKKGIEPKATVRLAVKMDEAFEYTSENILRITMLSEILNIRLREVIREDKGGVYGIGAGMGPIRIPQPTVRTIVYFGCDPARVDELINSVKDVFKEVKTTISNENITKAKEIMKNGYETDQKENRYWLRTVQSYDESGRDLNFIKNYKQSIDKVTDKELMEAAKKYFNYDKNFIRIVLMPENAE